MDWPRAPTAYVAENSLVGTPVEGEALGPAKFGPPSAVEYGGGSKGDGWGDTCMGEGERWGIMDRKPGKGITFEI